MIDKIDKENIDDDVKAIICFGSSINKNPLNKIDEFSDLDLIIYTTSVNKKITVNNIGWLSCFGKPMSIVNIKDPIGNSVMIRVMFDNCFCVDITLMPYSQTKILKNYFFYKKNGLMKIWLNSSHRVEQYLKNNFHILSRGYEVLYDKKNIKGLLDKIVKEYVGDEKVLDAYKFYNCYNEFWQYVYKLLSKIIRNDMYYVFTRVDCKFKVKLVEMLEWEAIYYYETKEQDDVLYYGKYINNWVDKTTFEDLTKTIFSFDTQNNIEILKNHINLFKRASKNVASVKGYNLHSDLETKILQKIEQYSK